MDQPPSSQNVHPHVDQPSTEPVPNRPATTTSGVTTQPTWNDSFGQLDMYAEQARVKLPAAPPGLLNFYMSWVPWLAIIFGILGILISLVALVGSTILGPLAVMFGSPGTGLGLILGSLFSLASAALELFGGIMMLQRKATGWWLLAFGLVVSLLTSLFRVSVIGLIVGLLIAYVHLQVKPNYRA
jgi:hypothetical protein